MARIGVCTNAVRHSVIPPPAHGRCASRLVVVLARVPRAVDASSRGGPQLGHIARGRAGAHGTVYV